MRQSHFLLLLAFSWACIFASPCRSEVVRNSDELRAALKSAKPGTEIVLADGIYTGQFDLTASGDPGKPITIRAQSTWKAWLDPAGGYGDGLDIGSGHDIVVDGIRVTGARTIGIRASNVQRVVLRNCRVECCMVQGVLIYGQACTVEFCLIQRNGLDGLSHGLYISGSQHVIQSNVIRDNAGYGFHAYPRVDSSIISHNVISGHSAKSGLLVFEGRYNFVLYNSVYANRVNVDMRQGSTTNRVLGNSETPVAAWPLATLPE